MASRVVFLVCLLVVLINTVYTAPPEEAKPLDCPAGEYYEKCSIAVCTRTCEHIRVSYPCPGIAPGCFMPECLCSDGKLRNDDGKCVSYKECL
ncbi:hypothetical protein ABMA28_001668 [Loxostege sticticalis]|uniref:TIL domain-containing protein n=1 Tax=Loxostege sticticalis TaxID=481309 RepID=A0ABD0T579_LOXSC